MINRPRDIWWLLLLEAASFFTVPCWELTAPYAQPMSYPVRFTACALSVATFATLACHVGPALLAGRRFKSWKLDHGVVIVVFVLGFWEWISAMVWITPWWIIPAALVIAFTHDVWKSAGLIGLLAGLGLLAWSCSVNYQGLWAVNPSFASPPAQLDSEIAIGIISSAAPALVIALCIGRVASTPALIWLSGLIGMWLPLVASVTFSSLTTQAGLNLHYKPSLARSFSFALISPASSHQDTVFALATATTLFATLLVPVGLRKLMMNANFPSSITRTVLIVFSSLSLVATLNRQYVPESSGFGSSIHQVWAGIVIFLGALAWTRVLLSRKSQPSGPPIK